MARRALSVPEWSGPRLLVYMARRAASAAVRAAHRQVLVDAVASVAALAVYILARLDVAAVLAAAQAAVYTLAAAARACLVRSARPQTDRSRFHTWDRRMLLALARCGSDYSTPLQASMSDRSQNKRYLPVRKACCSWRNAACQQARHSRLQAMAHTSGSAAG